MQRRQRGKDNRDWWNRKIKTYREKSINGKLAYNVFKKLISHQILSKLFKKKRQICNVQEWQV